LVLPRSAYVDYQWSVHNFQEIEDTAWPNDAAKEPVGDKWHCTPRPERHSHQRKERVPKWHTIRKESTNWDGGQPSAPGESRCGSRM